MEERELSTGIRILLILLSIFVSVAGIIIGIIWMSGNNYSQEKKDFGKVMLIVSVVMILLSFFCWIPFVFLIGQGFYYF